MDRNAAALYVQRGLERELAGALVSALGEFPAEYAAYTSGISLKASLAIKNSTPLGNRTLTPDSLFEWIGMLVPYLVGEFSKSIVENGTIPEVKDLPSFDKLSEILVSSSEILDEEHELPKSMQTEEEVAVIVEEPVIEQIAEPVVGPTVSQPVSPPPLTGKPAEFSQSQFEQTGFGKGKFDAQQQIITTVPYGQEHRSDKTITGPEDDYGEFIVSVTALVDQPWISADKRQMHLDVANKWFNENGAESALTKMQNYILTLYRSAIRRGKIDPNTPDPTLPKQATQDAINIVLPQTIEIEQCECLNQPWIDESLKAMFIDYAKKIESDDINYGLTPDKARESAIKQLTEYVNSKFEMGVIDGAIDPNTKERLPNAKWWGEEVVVSASRVKAANDQGGTPQGADTNPDDTTTVEDEDVTAYVSNLEQFLAEDIETMINEYYEGKEAPSNTSKLNELIAQSIKPYMSEIVENTSAITGDQERLSMANLYVNAVIQQDILPTAIKLFDEWDNESPIAPILIDVKQIQEYPAIKELTFDTESYDAQVAANGGPSGTADDPGAEGGTTGGAGDGDNPPLFVDEDNDTIADVKPENPIVDENGTIWIDDTHTNLLVYNHSTNPAFACITYLGSEMCGDKEQMQLLSIVGYDENKAQSMKQMWDGNDQFKRGFMGGSVQLLVNADGTIDPANQVILDDILGTTATVLQQMISYGTKSDWIESNSGFEYSEFLNVTEEELYNMLEAKDPRLTTLIQLAGRWVADENKHDYIVQDPRRQQQMNFNNYFMDVNRPDNKPSQERLEKIPWSPNQLWNKYEQKFADLIGMTVNSTNVYNETTGEWEKTRMSEERGGKGRFRFQSNTFLDRSQQEALWRRHVAPLEDFPPQTWPQEMHFEQALSGLEQEVNELWTKQKERHRADFVDRVTKLFSADYIPDTRKEREIATIMSMYDARVEESQTAWSAAQKAAKEIEREWTNMGIVSASMGHITYASKMKGVNFAIDYLKKMIKYALVSFGYDDPRAAKIKQLAVDAAIPIMDELLDSTIDLNSSQGRMYIMSWIEEFVGWAIESALNNEPIRPIKPFGEVGGGSDDVATQIDYLMT